MPPSIMKTKLINNTIYIIFTTFLARIFINILCYVKTEICLLSNPRSYILI